MFSALLYLYLTPQSVSFSCILGASISLTRSYVGSYIATIELLPPSRLSRRAELHMTSDFPVPNPATKAGNLQSIPRNSACGSVAVIFICTNNLHSYVCDRLTLL